MVFHPHVYRSMLLSWPFGDYRGAAFGNEKQPVSGSKDASRRSAKTRYVGPLNTTEPSL